MNNYSFIFTIIIFTLSFMNAAGIKCFQCNSLRDPGCAELGEVYGPWVPAGMPVTESPLNSSALLFYRECEDNHIYDGRQPFCRKMFQTIFARNRMQVVIRSCGWEAHPRLECYEFENKGHAETVCQCFEDGCNPASELTRAAPVLVVALVAVLVV